MLKHKPGVDVSNAPDIIARVFKMKLDQLIDLIKKKNYFGRCIGRKLSICLNLDNLGILKIVSTLFSKQLCT